MSDILNAPSIERVLQNLDFEGQLRLNERYRRLLPVLGLLLRPSDIARRNRTWPGSKPEGRAATSYLSTGEARIARDVIESYATQVAEDATELWQLFRAYCRFGPIGLLEVFSSDSPLVPDALQECADFHRLAKHPRADAGIYIRPLLEHYADELGMPRLSKFIARYAWASDRKLERWYVGESSSAEHVSRTARRVVLGQSYPHKRWRTHLAPLPIHCRITSRNKEMIQPWLIWMTDKYTSSLMGFRLCATEPTIVDFGLTLRWSIWHFGASWWPARGAPESVDIPLQWAGQTEPLVYPLSFLHTNLRPVPTESNDCTTSRYPGWPEGFEVWVNHQQRATRSPHAVWTIAELRNGLIEYVQETLLPTIAARTTPLTLQMADCSLPWSSGIGVVGLLPSGGHSQVSNNRVHLWGVPFDLFGEAIADGTTVNVRYDPDDARRVYAVVGQAKVVIAVASAFEHQMSWADLISTRGITV